MDIRGSVSQILNQVRVGDDQAANALWDRCFPRLVAIARRSLNGLPCHEPDAEDAAQSAFFSFWKKLSRETQLQELDRGGMWKLLATITIRKTNHQRRRTMALKRGGGTVQNESSLLSEQSGRRSLDDLMGHVPAVDFDQACEEWLLMLEEDLRPFAVLRVLGHSNEEAARLMTCSERTVERKLNLIRDIWTLELDRIENGA